MTENLIEFFKRNPVKRYLNSNEAAVYVVNRMEQIKDEIRIEPMSNDAIGKSIKHIQKAIQELTKLEEANNRSRDLANKLHALYMDFSEPHITHQKSYIYVDSHTGESYIYSFSLLAPKERHEELRTLILLWCSLYIEPPTNWENHPFNEFASIVLNDKTAPHYLKSIDRLHKSSKDDNNIKLAEIRQKIEID